MHQAGKPPRKHFLAVSAVALALSVAPAVAQVDGSEASGGAALAGNAVGGSALGGSAVGGDAVGGDAVGGDAVGGSATADGSKPPRTVTGGAATGGSATGGSVHGGRAYPGTAEPGTAEPGRIVFGLPFEEEPITSGTIAVLSSTDQAALEAICPEVSAHPQPFKSNLVATCAWFLDSAEADEPPAR